MRPSAPQTAHAVSRKLGLVASAHRGRGTALLGVGFGLVTQVLVLAVQNSVDRRDLGTVAAAADFFCRLGGSIGMALFGAVFVGQHNYWLVRDPSCQLAVAQACHIVFLVSVPIATSRLRGSATARRAPTSIDADRRPGAGRWIVPSALG